MSKLIETRRYGENELRQVAKWRFRFFFFKCTYELSFDADKKNRKKFSINHALEINKIKRNQESKRKTRYFFLFGVFDGVEDEIWKKKLHNNNNNNGKISET